MHTEVRDVAVSWDHGGGDVSVVVVRHSPPCPTPPLGEWVASSPLAKTRPVWGQDRGGHRYRCPSPKERGSVDEIPNKPKALGDEVPPHLRESRSRGDTPKKKA